jgi:Uma2 family endonuclease
MTAKDLFVMPEDNRRHELVEGVLVTRPPAGGLHGRVGARLAARLSAFVDHHALGEVYGAGTGFVLRRCPDTVRAPDAAFVSWSRLQPLNDDPADDWFLELAPDLAIEVLEVSDTIRDVATRVLEYLDAGTLQVRVVDPYYRLITIYTADGAVRTLREHGTPVDCELLPGFRLAVVSMPR